MFGIFDKFHDNPVFRYFALIMFVICFIEMVRRCVVHYNEKRDGKEQAKLDKMRENEEMGSQSWEKEE